MFKNIVRYYIIFCICQLMVILLDQKLIINQFVVAGVVFVFLFIAPMHTLFILVMHYLKMNRKIFGNLTLEIITSILPLIIIYIYSFIISNLTKNAFILSEDGKWLHKKWYLDDMNIGITSYVVFFFILLIHGRRKN